MAAAVAAASLLAAACGGDGAEPTERAAPLSEGDPAPPFTLEATDGGTVTLDDVVGSRPVLFYFSMGPG